MSFHFEYPRTIAARRPGEFKPAAPKFHVRWQAPVTTIVSDYIAVQRQASDMAAERAFFQRMRRAFDSAYGPDSFEEMRQTDEAGMVNSIVVAYWTDIVRYALWKHVDSFNAWFRSTEREQEAVGYWRETLTVPYDRMETIFSEPYYHAGLARTRQAALEPMYTAGYFGAMRDRLPISAIDPLNSPYGETTPEGNYAGGPVRRVRVDVPPNVVSIRSGQVWQKAEGEQLDDYYQNLQPKLETGMAYLKEHPETTGYLSLRAIVHLDKDGQELRETSKHGYFLALAQLERWAAEHKSHLDIFKHALAMRRKYGADRQVVTWHEVFVLGTTPSLEYINCHPGTGLLRFANVWGNPPPSN
ncbi:phenylacetaldoxime dehydratase family protein [Trinickia mobilis]|uniref:phenylacetaldoxime dehydratase family protein n=1 Tax=Trinickia mobilis TaxID=2816356 RepID=UPI001A8CAF4D|nr:phenylacetaldoxime dehydratase family protein [Trinickia mobilis]